MSKTLYAHILILLATFISGGSFLVSQKLSGVINPISINLLRFLIATVTLLPFIFLKKEYRVKLISTFKRAFIISFFYTSFLIGMFISLEYTTALNTGAIFTLVPLLTALLSMIFFKQKIPKKQYIVYLFGIIGTCIVVFKASLQLLLSLTLNKGDIFFLISILFISMYSICAKYFYKEDDELFVLVFMTLVGGCIWMSFALIIFNIPLQWDRINANDFVSLGYLSIPATLVTAYLYQKCTVILGPKKIMAYTYLTPASIAILMFVVSSQVLSYWVIIGILISTFSTVMLLRKS
ncbi:DMT family transporter [Candidatus Marinarcus aquaticus]|uniref:EamA family transporter n=1 Tax=Candidatus Marinarcus aquaticus TaxID=2044504 RepID=A0A4V1LNM4_9BACT|nr:DMT family transporter [Candidatus Marinarcus aquaticus]RXJ54169.1 EamA family transporter [Candidatus Marinarcus aquaticus]